ncbi:MAG: DUF1648 domain-containing protein [Micromonosporaceae bacterium]|nr:DUF1648 domain-containing protein [Micromonosporaceae bacterium]
MNATLTVDQRMRRRRHVTGAVTTVGGLLVLLIAAGITWSWRAQLPDPVASHWGADGQPDGFSSLGGILAVLLGLGGGLVLLFGAATWVLGQTSVTRRIGAAATAWVSLFMAVVVVGSLFVQRGLSDAREAGSVNTVLLVGLLVPIVPAVIAAIVVPGDLRQPTTDPVPADAPRVKLVDGERAVWIRRASTPVGFYLAAPVILVGVALFVWARAWPMLVVDALVIAVLVILTTFVVRVDRAGLTVRSAGGWPRYRVPLDEVVRAGVTQVSPVKDFGGWGWRVGRDGRVGVVLRKGEALLVERTGGRSIVVTVDEPAKGAGLLNTLADRARTGG